MEFSSARRPKGASTCSRTRRASATPSSRAVTDAISCTSAIPSTTVRGWRMSIGVTTRWGAATCRLLRGSTLRTKLERCPPMGPTCLRAGYATSRRLWLALPHRRCVLNQAFAQADYLILQVAQPLVEGEGRQVVAPHLQVEL